MITVEKMNLFIKYRGNNDTFSLTASSEEKKLSEDWAFINDLVLDLVLINRKFVSSNFKEITYRRINESFDSQKSKDLLLTFARGQS